MLNKEIKKEVNENEKLKKHCEEENYYIIEDIYVVLKDLDDIKEKLERIEKKINNKSSDLEQLKIENEGYFLFEN